VGTGAINLASKLRRTDPAWSSVRDQPERPAWGRRGRV